MSKPRKGKLSEKPSAGGGGIRVAKLESQVARMLTEWEGSDELAGDFTDRLLSFFARHLDELPQALRKRP